MRWYSDLDKFQCHGQSVITSTLPASQVRGLSYYPASCRPQERKAETRKPLLMSIEQALGVVT
ncbi:hypothetical protein E4U54_004195 [Claviceps lovelessii]|nr:hypothetical protein E4U54_004195 [Claviceps lovelessii]